MVSFSVKCIFLLFFLFSSISLYFFPYNTKKELCFSIHLSQCLLCVFCPCPSFSLYELSFYLSLHSICHSVSVSLPLMSVCVVYLCLFFLCLSLYLCKLNPSTVLCELYMCSEKLFLHFYVLSLSILLCPWWLFSVYLYPIM